MDSPNARYGIMASGKSYEDIRQALRELGITEEVAAKIGLRLYKIGMPWPLEPEGVRKFAVGLEEIFIVEERREIVENQVKQELFNWRDDVRPRIVGKMDDHDKRFLTFAAELSVASLASSLTERLLRLNLNPEIAEMLRAKADWFNGRQATQMQAVAPVTRTPYFCSGCPHNTSTKVPEGSRAFAGIGCHFMALWMDRIDRDLHPYGRRGRAVGRRRAVHQGGARVRQSRRRHLFPFRQPRDPPGGRLRRQHHLQDPLQRRDRDDRRPACRRRIVAAADHLPASLGRHPRDLSRLGKSRRLSGVRHRARRQDRASRRTRRGPEDAAARSRAPRRSCSCRPAPPKSAAAASAA